jgi:hypothetical protein
MADTSAERTRRTFQRAFHACPRNKIMPFLPSRVVESLDLRERAMQPQLETTNVSAESTTRIKGLLSLVPVNAFS